MPPLDVTHVFVLSARHSLNQKGQDLLLKDRSAEDIDIYDDLERMLTGIQTAYDITASRLRLLVMFHK